MTAFLTIAVIVSVVAAILYARDARKFADYARDVHTLNSQLMKHHDACMHAHTDALRLHGCTFTTPPCVTCSHLWGCLPGEPPHTP